jgi:hypothetical protein
VKAARNQTLSISRSCRVEIGQKVPKESTRPRVQFRKNSHLVEEILITNLDAIITKDEAIRKKLGLYFYFTLFFTITKVVVIIIIFYFFWLLFVN